MEMVKKMNQKHFKRILKIEGPNLINSHMQNICWNEYILRTLIKIDRILIEPTANNIFYAGAIDHRSAIHQEAC
jgi:hypothetical protein